jgi:diadenosine tetraphosphate (Ap4A) HIT family hydrolase
MCLTCDIVQNKMSPIGGLIYKDEYVILHHCIDQNIPGYLILSPLRHLESYGDLEQNEIFQMGIIAKRAICALKKIEGIEKVYLASFGEETPHFHMHIFPKYKWMLNYSKENICIDNKIDGAKLLSFCRKQCKVKPEQMKQSNITAAIEHIRHMISGHYLDNKITNL